MTVAGSYLFDLLLVDGVWGHLSILQSRTTCAGILDICGFVKRGVSRVVSVYFSAA